MKRNVLRFISFLAAAVCASMLASCPKGENGDPSGPNPNELFFTHNASFDIPPMAYGVPIEHINVSTGVSGGRAPFMYTATELPQGITIHSATGVISGIPTQPTGRGDDAYITVTDSSTPKQQKTITIHCGAVSQPPPAPTYTVTVTAGEGGTAEVSTGMHNVGTSIEVTEGETITLHAAPTWNNELAYLTYILRGWTVTAGGPLTITEGDLSSLLLKFTMPAKDVAVRVDFELPILNYRITWDDINDRYALTNNLTNGGLFFKFGSVAGIYTDEGKVLKLPVDPDYTWHFFEAKNVAWCPTPLPVPGIGEYELVWQSIPCYTEDDYPKQITPFDGYHTVANVKLGKGDPCRLVGLDLDKIKTTNAASLTNADIDNGIWRLPHPIENRMFAGTDVYVSTENHVATMPNGTRGGIFPDVGRGNETTFLPFVGYRQAFNGVMRDWDIEGCYWANAAGLDMAGNLGGAYFNFHTLGILPYGYNEFNLGFSVRCVRQDWQDWQN